MHLEFISRKGGLGKVNFPQVTFLFLINRFNVLINL